MQHLLTMIAAIQVRSTEFADRERGATATEYALLVAFIALAIIIGVTAFGSALNSFFSDLASRVGLF
jgi:pilus assembly protein Flp/PilA